MINPIINHPSQQKEPTMTDLKKDDLPDLSGAGEAKPKTPNPKGRKPKKKEKSDVAVDSGNVDRNAVRDDAVSDDVAASPAAGPDQIDGALPPLLMGGPGAGEVRRLDDRPFTTLRVGRKWYARVVATYQKHTDANPDDPNRPTLKVDIHQSVRDPDNPSAKSSVGEYVGTYQVLNAELVPYYNVALEKSSRTNHLCVLGASKAKLDEVIRAAYPDDVFKQVGADEEDGFTILSLQFLHDDKKPGDTDQSEDRNGQG